MASVTPLAPKATVEEVQAMFTAIEDMLEYVDSDNKGWMGKKRVMTALPSNFTISPSWKLLFKATVKQPNVLAAKKIADTQQAKYTANLWFPGDKEDGTPDETTGDYTDTFMLIKA